MFKKLLLLSFMSIFVFYFGEDVFAQSEGETVIGADGDVLSEEEQGVLQPEPKSEGEITPFINQSPNSDILLSRYNFSGRRVLSSNYCTATQSHINIQVNNTGSGVKATFQRRAPNGNWITSSTKRINSSSYYTYNWNAVKGHDYRVQVEGTAFLNSSGVITCW